MMGCLVGGVLLAGLLTQMGAFMAFLGVLIWIVAAGTGVNAAGLLHMDDARGISPRSTVDALVHGLMCIPKLIALAILLFLVELAVFLVIAIVLFICKIPFLGPVLFTGAFPVSVVVAGITVLGLFLCMLLSLPAIWQGATIMRALSQTLAIARSRIVEAILLLAVVWLLAFVVALIVFGVLAAGLMPTLGLSASILSFGDLGSMMGGWAAWGHGWMRGMGGGGGGGHVVAGGLGLGVLWAVAASLVAQVYLLGLPGLPAGHRRPRPQRHRGGTAAKARRGAQPRQRSRREGRRASHRAAPPPPAGMQAAVLHPTGADAAALSRRHGRWRRAAFAAAPPPPPCRRPTRRPRPTCRRRPLRHRPTSTCRSTTLAHPATPPTATPAYSPPAYSPPAYHAAAGAACRRAGDAGDLDCPQCLSPVTGEDVFCGVCGYRLK
jgi:hypothetical protein